MFLPHYDSVVDLCEISTGELIRVLLDARGQQKCAHLRTRLNQVLEARTGHRGNSNGRDRVLSNRDN